MEEEDLPGALNSLSWVARKGGGVKASSAQTAGGEGGSVTKRTGSTSKDRIKLKAGDAAGLGAKLQQAPQNPTTNSPLTSGGSSEKNRGGGSDKTPTPEAAAVFKEPSTPQAVVDASAVVSAPVALDAQVSSGVGTPPHSTPSITAPTSSQPDTTQSMDTGKQVQISTYDISPAPGSPVGGPQNYVGIDDFAHATVAVQQQHKARRQQEEQQQEQDQQHLQHEQLRAQQQHQQAYSSYAWQVQQQQRQHAAQQQHAIQYAQQQQQYLAHPPHTHPISLSSPLPRPISLSDALRADFRPLSTPDGQPVFSPQAPTPPEPISLSDALQAGFRPVSTDGQPVFSPQGPTPQDSPPLFTSHLPTLFANNPSQPTPVQPSLHPAYTVPHPQAEQAALHQAYTVPLSYTAPLQHTQQATLQHLSTFRSQHTSAVGAAQAAVASGQVIPQLSRYATAFAPQDPAVRVLGTVLSQLLPGTIPKAYFYHHPAAVVASGGGAVGVGAPVCYTSPVQLHMSGSVAGSTDVGLMETPAQPHMVSSAHLSNPPCTKDLSQADMSLISQQEGEAHALMPPPARVLAQQQAQQAQEKQAQVQRQMQVQAEFQQQQARIQQQQAQLAQEARLLQLQQASSARVGGAAGVVGLGLTPALAQPLQHTCGPSVYVNPNSRAAPHVPLPVRSPSPAVAGGGPMHIEQGNPTRARGEAGEGSREVVLSSSPVGAAPAPAAAITADAAAASTEDLPSVHLRDDEDDVLACLEGIVQVGDAEMDTALFSQAEEVPMSSETERVPSFMLDSLDGPL